MIQRIQSFFLAMVLTLGIASLFVPFVRYDLPGGPINVDLMPGATLHPLSGIYLLPVFLNIVSILFTVYVILNYKKRVFQMKLANLLMALNTILLGVLLLFDFVELPVTTELLQKKYLLGDRKSTRLNSSH